MKIQRFSLEGNMRKPIWLLIVISLFFANFVAVLVAAQKSDAPFIFYYGAGEIVIERADGTDRRVLGEGMNLRTLNNLTWSSTGRWIAWDNIDYDVYGDIAVDSIIISAVRYDNEQQFTFEIQEIYRDVYWRWSPTEDWLMITQVSGNYDELITEVQVIDVNSNDTLLAFTDDESPPRWATDGHTLERTLYEQIPSLDDPSQTQTTYTRQIISMDGDMQEMSITAPHIHRVSDDMFIYWDAAQASYIIDGSAYETPISINSPPDMSIQSLYWNNSHQYALIYALESIPDSDALYEQNFYLLSLEDHTITFIDTFRISPLANDLSPAITSIYRVDWSPTDNAILIYASDGYPNYINYYYYEYGWGNTHMSLYMLSLSTFSIELVTPNPMELFYGGEHSVPTPINQDWIVWTPDGSRFLFATDFDDSKELAWYDVQTRQTTPINLPSHSDIYGHRISLPTYGLNWSDDNESAILTWLHDSWLYDATTDMISDEPISQHSLAYISPDGQFAASLVACHSRLFHDDGPARGKCLINLMNGERTDLVETDGIMKGGGGVASWHPTEPWVILITDHSERYAAFEFTITDTTGQFYRRILDTVDYHGTVKWLPENVPIDE